VKVRLSDAAVVILSLDDRGRQQELLIAPVHYVRHATDFEGSPESFVVLAKHYDFIADSGDYPSGERRAAKCAARDIRKAVDAARLHEGAKP